MWPSHFQLMLIQWKMRIMFPTKYIVWNNLNRSLYFSVFSSFPTVSEWTGFGFHVLCSPQLLTLMLLENGKALNICIQQQFFARLKLHKLKFREEWQKKRNKYHRYRKWQLFIIFFCQNYYWLSSIYGTVMFWKK